jgi:hypothetical protein
MTPPAVWSDKRPRSPSSTCPAVPTSRRPGAFLRSPRRDGHQPPLPVPRRLDVRTSRIIAAGLPPSFQRDVAEALGLDTDEVAWVQSMPAVEELLMRASSPVDMIVLSPEVKEANVLPMAEFVGRISPGTAIVLVCNDSSWNGSQPAARRAGIHEVVVLTKGKDAVADAIKRFLPSRPNR